MLFWKWGRVGNSFVIERPQVREEDATSSRKPGYLMRKKIKLDYFNKRTINCFIYLSKSYYLSKKRLTAV